MPKEKLDHQKISGLETPPKTISYYDTVETGLMLRHSAAGSKTFCYRYRFSKKKRRYTIGQFPGVSLREARERVRELKVQVNNGIDPQIEKRKKKYQPDSKDFDKLVDSYKKRYLPTLRESTQAEYKRILDNELWSELKGLPVTEISEHHIRSILEAKAIDDGSPTMANRIRAVLSSLFKYAIKKLGIKILNNPVKATSPYKSGENKRDRVYSEEEIKNLWSFFEKQDPAIEAIFKMLLLTGQRKTETMRMKWSDIEMEKPYKRTRFDDEGNEYSEAFLVNVWTIPAENAKNKRTHEIPLSKMAMVIIEEMREISEGGEYVFKSPRKENKPVVSLRSACQRIQKYSKVQDFRLHDLRRTVATYMAESGISPMVIGKVLNHKGLAKENSITARYNRHDYMDQKRQALNRWMNRLEKILW